MVPVLNPKQKKYLAIALGLYLAYKFFGRSQLEKETDQKIEKASRLNEVYVFPDGTSKIEGKLYLSPLEVQQRVELIEYYVNDWGLPYEVEWKGNPFANLSIRDYLEVYKKFGKRPYNKKTAGKLWFFNDNLDLNEIINVDFGEAYTQEYKDPRLNQIFSDWWNVAKPAFIDWFMLTGTNDYTERVKLPQ
jgi:hypothetical protein